MYEEMAGKYIIFDFANPENPHKNIYKYDEKYIKLPDDSIKKISNAINVDILDLDFTKC